ncbi:MAG: hypothetical protein LBB38_01300, partial [Puniceicoccales bacterium]|nr:hypothetical protein [Puniceicoccales bacterium]
MDSAEFEAIDVAVNQFYGQIDGYQNTLCDRLCECEDEGEIDRLFSLISNMDRVDSLARALELKVMFDGGVAPMVLRLAETSSRCMANADASGENVPWAELANLFGQTMAVACARQ